MGVFPKEASKFPVTVEQIQTHWNTHFFWQEVLMSFEWAIGSKQCVQVDLALPQHLGNLTSIPSFTSRLLCVTLEAQFCLFWSSLSLQEETSLVKASYAIWPYSCCCPGFQRANIPVIGKRLRSDCFLFKRQMPELHLNRGLVLAVCSLYSTGCSLSFRKKENNPYMPERQMQKQNTSICLG